MTLINCAVCCDSLLGLEAAMPLKRPAAAVERVPSCGRARYCTVCQSIKRDGPRHKYDTGHAVVALTAEQRATLAEEP
eukprot:11612228-Alexandrium_andersonii.AAC.1